MIIIKLKGGLGNQLFQYALGQKLQILKHTGVKYDIKHYSHQKKETTIRKLLVDKIVKNFQAASINDIDKSKGWNLPAIIRKPKTLINKILPYYKRNIIKEKSLSFDTNIFKCPKNCYLDGFWQSFKYFDDIYPHLIQLINFNNLNLDQKKLEILNLIKSTNSVAIHIRRGDYINPYYKNIYNILDENYYSLALKTIDQKIQNPLFFVFGDFNNWIPNNLNDRHFILIKFDEITDLYLLTQVKHIIISNSTFAWWGAWLNQNPNKIVIAPSVWYKKTNFRNFKINDLIPNNWIKL